MKARSGRQLEPEIREGALESTLHGVSEAVGYHAWLASHLEPSLAAPVLEIGAGLGGLTRSLTELTTPVLASEPDDDLRRQLEELALPGLVAAPPLWLPLTSQPTFSTEPASVVMSNVLEHIEDDVGALRSLLDHTSAVRLLIVVPAHQWAYTGLDQALGHYRRYTRSTLTDVVRQSGWTIERVRYFNPLGALAWAISGRLLGRTTIEPWQTRAVERGLPVLRFVDRLLGGKVFGQSVIAVASRSADGD